MSYQGICGQLSPEGFGQQELCVLEHSHAGWHESDGMAAVIPLGVVAPMRWGMAEDLPTFDDEGEPIR